MKPDVELKELSADEMDLSTEMEDASSKMVPLGSTPEENRMNWRDGMLYSVIISWILFSWACRKNVSRHGVGGAGNLERTQTGLVCVHLQITFMPP